MCWHSRVTMMYVLLADEISIDMKLACTTCVWIFSLTTAKLSCMYVAHQNTKPLNSIFCSHSTTSFAQCSFSHSPHDTCPCTHIQSPLVTTGVVEALWQGPSCTSSPMMALTHKEATLMLEGYVKSFVLYQEAWALHRLSGCADDVTFICKCIVVHLIAKQLLL